MRFKLYLLADAAYPGNLGVIELFKFYQVATQKQIDRLEAILKREDWNAFKKIIKEVLGVILV